MTGPNNDNGLINNPSVITIAARTKPIAFTIVPIPTTARATRYASVYRFIIFEL